MNLLNKTLKKIFILLLNIKLKLFSSFSLRLYIFRYIKLIVRYIISFKRHIIFLKVLKSIIISLIIFHL